MSRGRTSSTTVLPARDPAAAFVKGVPDMASEDEEEEEEEEGEGEEEEEEEEDDEGFFIESAL